MDKVFFYGVTTVDKLPETLPDENVADKTQAAATPEAPARVAAIPWLWKKIKEREWLAIKPISLGLVSGIVGFLGGVLVLFYDYGEAFDARDKAFVNKHQVQLWLLIVVAQTAFWGAICQPLLKTVWSLRKYLYTHLIEVFIWFALFTILLLFSKIFSPSCEYWLPKHESKLKIISYVGFFLASIAGIGSILINIALRESNAEFTSISIKKDLAAGRDKKVYDAEISETDKKLEAYFNLRRCYKRLLSFLGVMLGLGTLIQGAKRLAMLSIQADCTPDYSYQRVLIYGLYFTIILSLAFVPTFMVLISIGRKIHDALLLPMPSIAAGDWNKWYTKRKNLEELLQISFLETTRIGLAILAPIIGGLTSILNR
jgi:hypothetical protein